VRLRGIQLLAVLAVFSIASCSLRTTRSATVTFAHSSGGPGPHIVFVTIDSSGGIVREEGTVSLRGRVDERLAATLLAEMNAEATQQLLAALRAKRYQSGCCDLEDIYIELDGVVTEAPVYDFEFPDAADVRLIPALPAALVDVLRKVDALAESAFGARHSYTIAPRSH
jgi:hypothetical protein